MQNLTTTYDSMHIDLNKFNTHFVQVYVHGLSIWESTSKNQLMFSNAHVGISLIITNLTTFQSLFHIQVLHGCTLEI
jgi:hypothetical protein